MLFLLSVKRMDVNVHRVSSEKTKVEFNFYFLGYRQLNTNFSLFSSYRDTVVLTLVDIINLLVNTVFSLRDLVIYSLISLVRKILYEYLGVEQQSSTFFKEQ
jgi:hypothetical protein